MKNMFNSAKNIIKPSSIFQLNFFEVFHIFMGHKNIVNFDFANFHKYMFNQIIRNKCSFSNMSLFDRQNKIKQCVFF